MTAHFYDYNAFPLDHDIIFTTQMGKLQVFDCQETVPGDVIRGQADVLVRMMPTLAPFMHRVNVYVHDWWVPKRILWDNYEKFYTGGRDGQDASVHPYITSPSGGWTEGSVADGLGFPTGVSNLKCDALPFRAVAMIYNEWYRDEFLIDPVALSFADGADATTYTGDYYRAWGHGYFEDARPTMQLGPQVHLPSLNGSLPVYGDGKALMLNRSGDNIVGMVSGTNASVNGDLSVSSGITENYANGASLAHGSMTGSLATGVATKAQLGTLSSGLVTGDISSIAGIPVSEARQAFQTQGLFELMARGGARFREVLSNLFAVQISDKTIQRPLFLGGGKVPLSIGEILQTSSTDSTSPQGNMAGRGISAQRTRAWRHSFEEPGYIISILNIRPKAVYGQGLARQFSRWTRFDEYWPIFNHLSMQAILNKEVAAQGSSVVDSDGQVIDELPWGYTPIYNELRHIPSRVAGAIKSTMDFWSLWRKFDIANDGVPGLDEDFINCKPDNRIFAVPSGDHFTVQVVQRWSALRRLSKYGTPGLIDHH